MVSPEKKVYRPLYRACTLWHGTKNRKGLDVVRVRILSPIDFPDGGWANVGEHGHAACPDCLKRAGSRVEVIP